MTGEAATAPTTLAILLGGSAWPKSPQLAASTAFASSALGFRQYLVDPNGFGLPQANVLDLFDSSKTAPEIVEEIQNYLRLRMSGTPAPRDLFLYYTGHGGFIGGRDYFLAVRSTIEGLEGSSSIRVSDLASALRNAARDVRRFLILDCCFAAAAFREFQSTPGAAARLQTLDAFPRRGTTLLCSSSSRSVSIAPEGEQYTMFSGALLDVLRRGDAGIQASLSLEDVGLRVGDIIKRKYDDRGIRPEVHSPDQRDEDIARMPIFPNASGAPLAVALAGPAIAAAIPVVEPSPPAADVVRTINSRAIAIASAAVAIIVVAVLVGMFMRGPAAPSKAVPANPQPSPLKTDLVTPPPVVSKTTPQETAHVVQPPPQTTHKTAPAVVPEATTSPTAARTTERVPLPTTLNLNGTTVRFASVPGAQFRMGCTAGDTECEEDEKPKNVLVDAFQMGTTEVTQAQWQAVMSTNPSNFKGPERPVENISWRDAREFLERLTGRNDGFTYRLPTEAEWEYAARANAAPVAPKLVAWFGLAQVSEVESRPQTVAKKAANAWGFFDMLGNVAEWCDEWYVKDYQRLVKGGSWEDSAKSVRVSARAGAKPTERSLSVGMRIVREPKT
jgi:formylglycine-generating enzyme required for sulfatase activity